MGKDHQHRGSVFSRFVDYLLVLMRHEAATYEIQVLVLAGKRGPQWPNDPV